VGVLPEYVVCAAAELLKQLIIRLIPVGAKNTRKRRRKDKRRLFSLNPELLLEVSYFRKCKKKKKKTKLMK
jgi:hypothetical protein